TTSGMLLAVNTRTEREAWRDQGGFSALAGIRDGLVIALAGGNRVVGLDARTGARRWQTPVGRGESEQWAVLHGDAVLVAGDGGPVAVGAPPPGGGRWAGGGRGGRRPAGGGGGAGLRRHPGPAGRRRPHLGEGDL